MGQRGLWGAAGLAGLLLLLSRRGSGEAWPPSAGNVAGIYRTCETAARGGSEVRSQIRHGRAAARGWAGLVLLARAAAYAKERDNYTTLFDYKTFAPTIAGPPFVRALTELVEAAKLGPAEQLEYDPAAVRAEFWKGTTAMAISWPTAARVGDGGKAPTRKALTPSPSPVPGEGSMPVARLRRIARRGGGLPRLKRQVGTAKRRRRAARAAAGHCRTDRRGRRGQQARRCGVSTICSG